MTENAYIYSRDEMPPTPGGRRVQDIEGDVSGIRTRATQIAELGEKMSRAAATLELFADGTIGKGASFDAVREQAREVHDDLRVAAQRYLPSGEALGDYATALSIAQSATGWRVSGAHRTWPEVNAASSALSGAESDQDEWDRNDRNDVDQTGSRPSTAGEQSGFDSAVETWQAYWEGYDAPAEAWETAYESACSSLEGANEDGVRDGFWDNAMPFVEAMLDVLLVVGIVLLVIAFVVTGPLAMLAGVLAVVAGVLSLLGEIAKLNAGRGDWGSVALAAVGIIPFGKLAKLGQLADFAQVGARFPRLSGALRLGGSEFVDYGSSFSRFMRAKMPCLYDTLDDAGELIARTPHGLNSRNMFRALLSPVFPLQGNSLVGGWRAGWQALAGNPTNAAEALGGAADVYLDVVSILKDANERLTSPR